MEIDIDQLFHLVFETYTGVGILVGGGLLISLLAAFLLEFKTRKLYKEHQRGEGGVDEWAIFADEVEEAEAAEAAREKEVAK